MALSCIIQLSLIQVRVQRAYRPDSVRKCRPLQSTCATSNPVCTSWLFAMRARHGTNIPWCWNEGRKPMTSSSPVKPQSLQGRVGRVPSSLLRDDKDDPSLHDRPTASQLPHANIMRAGLNTPLCLLAPLFVLGAVFVPLRAQSSAPETLQRALHFADLYNWTDAAPEF